MIINAELIKRSVSMRDVLQHLNVNLDSRNKGKCPVHGGTDKNFSVKGDIAACWSQCGGQKWDTIGIIQELADCDYITALETLAAIAGIPIEYDGSINREEFNKKAAEEHKEAVSILAANETYLAALSQLTATDEQYTEVAGRTLKNVTVEKYLIRGPLPADKSPLWKNFAKLTLNKDVLLQAGLIKQGEKGLYDTFRDRIMYPVRNDRGKLVGFVGRVIPGKEAGDAPKYLNSPESALYKKGETLYGLYEARKAINDAGYAILTEGQMDCISLADHGLENTIAGGGTALTIHQARILARYTQSVVLLYDGDEAGSKAAERNILPLLAAGIIPKIYMMPPGRDPDDYVRAFGGAALQAEISGKSQEAVLWAVTKDWVRDDVFSTDQAIQRAVKLLGEIPKAAVRQGYIEILATKDWLGRSAGKLLKDGVAASEKSKSQRDYKYTAIQREDIVKYNLFERENKYYHCHDIKQGGHEISNFVIKPVMLVVGNEYSQRVVEVRNEHGHSFVRSISSDDFVELTAFKKQMERMGNYLYKGKPEQFINIKEKIYMQTPTAFPITTMGLHRVGFYAWSNGITTPEGKFLKVDEYGIVEYEGTRYYLPAFSKIHHAIKSDDLDNSFESDREFIYIDDKPGPGIREWSANMIQIYGEPVKMAISYYIAALYRDMIFRKTNFFPHLNLFGPPTSGKSYMGWSLAAMFGRAKKPFHLMQGTNVGFYRRLAQSRNAIVVFDEYSNDLDVKRVEALKSAYDGMGHEKGVKSNDNRTVETSVNSALVIMGQQQTTKDVALFTRCITISFKKVAYTDDQMKFAEQFKAMGDTGRLSQITGRLHKWRDYVAMKWNRVNDEVTTELRNECNREVTARMIANYAIPLTAIRIIQEVEEIAFTYDEVKAWALENIQVQHKAIGNDDELSVWWRIMEYGLADRKLDHDKDVLVERHHSITVKSVHLPGMKKPDSDRQEITWEKEKTLLFLRFERTFPLYALMHRQQFNKTGLPLGSIQHYLRYSPAYVGEVQSKKFAGKNKYAWVFDAEKLNIELDLTRDIMYTPHDPHMLQQAISAAKATRPNHVEDTDTMELPF